MAETAKTQLTEYTIPLRRAWLNRPTFDRTARAVSTIKTYLSKHCKIDASKIKIDTYFNNTLWLRGRRSPPGKIKVKVSREADLLKVAFVEDPTSVKFDRIKNARFHTASAEVKAESKPEAKKEESKEDAAKDNAEKEKEVSTAIARAKDAKQEAKAQKHVTKVEKVQHPQRMALQK